MKSPKYLLMVVVCALGFFSCSTEELPEDNYSTMALQQAPPPKAIELEILTLINEYRVEKGLPTLQDLEVIKSVAFSHTDYMVVNNVVSHDNFSQRYQSLVSNAGATKVSENVAYAYNSAQSVVNAWINSDSHREALEGDFSHFDVSAEQNEEGRWYYTNIFIKR